MFIFATKSVKNMLRVIVMHKQYVASRKLSQMYMNDVKYNFLLEIRLIVKKDHLPYVDHYTLVKYGQPAC